MKSGEIEVYSKNGNMIKTIKLSLPGIVSINFLREDGQGNICIQTERLDKGNILLEVHRYNPKGTYLTTVPIPENDYSSWSVKLLSLDEQGTIYQFLPKKDKGQVNIFHKD